MTLQELYTDESKWCVGMFERDDGSMCMVGALRKCYPNMVERFAASSRLERACGGSVIAFNDSCRDFKMIQAVVKQANV